MCCRVSNREDYPNSTSSPQDVLIGYSLIMMGIWDSGPVLILSREELLSTNYILRWHTSVSKHSHPETAELQKSKNKVSTFSDLPRTMDLDGLGLCFCFGRCCCLLAGFQVLDGTSFYHGVSCAKVSGLLRIESKEGNILILCCDNHTRETYGAPGGENCKWLEGDYLSFGLLLFRV